MNIGANIPSVGGRDRLRGATCFVDDLQVPGVLHGGTVRSAVARGVLRGVHFDPDIDWSGFTIVDHRDIPGPNEVLFIDRDQPALVRERVSHAGEPIVLLAHPSISALRRALGGVRVDIEPLPAVEDPEQPLSPELIQFGDANVFKHTEILKGDPDAVFDTAAHVIEGHYRSGAQEHVYLETQGVLVYPEGSRLVVKGTMQCPFYVLKSLMHLFGRPAEAFQVIQTPTGGGFGGKEDYPSILAIHAALLADKARAPVKMIYDRQEDMAVTTKRHPGRVRHRTALDADGRLLAMDIEVLLDGGAFMTLSPVVLSRGAIHAAGPYACEHVRIVGEARLTNTPPNGAFRGFGAPQTLFAVERHMDVIARRLGLPPEELRRRNLLRKGHSTATGQVIREDIDLPGLLNRALDLADYGATRQRFAAENGRHPYLRRGIGFATFYHGSGFTGAGESYLASEVWVEGLPDGRVEVLSASTDMGQGTETVLMQVVTERLGLDPQAVVIRPPDTSRVPDSGPTVASRTVMIVGRLIEQACDDLRRQLGDGAADLPAALRRWHAEHPGQRLLGKARYEKPPEIQWDEARYQGDAYAAYAWAAHVAEVEVDLRTWAVKVTDYVALQEVGRVVNPVLAAGQIQGGVAQGIGWALLEEVVTEQGRMSNCQMTNYIIPACGDLPPIRVYFEELPSPYGPGGAKGLGELPMDGPAPAILNALSDALDDAALDEVPMTPERLMACLEGQAHG